MALDRISLTDFRNHAATELGGTGQFNLLVGENGAGKTNILEALSLLAPGRGLRRVLHCRQRRLRKNPEVLRHLMRNALLRGG